MFCYFNENKPIELSNTGPNYSYFTALSSGLLILITTTVLAIILVSFNPITDPLLFKAMGGYFIAVPLAVLDTAGGVGFSLSLYQMVANASAHKKPALRPTTEIFEEPREVVRVSTQAVIIEESLKIVEIVEEDKSLDTETKNVEEPPPQRVEIVVEETFTEVKIERVEEFVVGEIAQENISTLSSEEITAIHAQINTIVTNTFDPLIDELVGLATSALAVNAKMMKCENRTKQAEDAIRNLMNILKSLLTNEQFVLENTLSALFGPDAVSHNKRSLGAALYARDENKIRELVLWSEEVARKKDLHGAKEIIRSKDKERFRAELPKAFANCFARDDAVMIAFVERIIRHVFDQYNCEDLIEYFEFSEETKNDVLALEFHTQINKLFKEVFNRDAAEDGKTTNNPVLKSIAAEILRYNLIDMGVGPKVNGILKIVAAGINVLQLFIDPKIVQKNLEGLIFKGFYFAENAQFEHSFKDDAHYQDILKAQVEINKGRPKSGQVALFRVKKEENNPIFRQAIASLKKEEVDIGKAKAKIEALNSKLPNHEEHTIIAIRCHQQNIAEDFAMLKGYEGYAGTIKRFGLDLFLDGIISALASALPTKDKLNTRKPSMLSLGNLAKTIAGYFLNKYKEDLAAFTIPGLNEEELVRLHQAILDLVPAFAYIGVDTLFGDKENKFKKEVIYKLVLKDENSEEKNPLEQAKDTLGEIGETLKVEGNHWNEIKNKVNALFTTVDGKLKAYLENQA